MVAVMVSVAVVTATTASFHHCRAQGAGLRLSCCIKSLKVSFEGLGWPANEFNGHESEDSQSFCNECV